MSSAIALRSTGFPFPARFLFKVARRSALAGLDVCRSLNTNTPGYAGDETDTIQLNNNYDRSIPDSRSSDNELASRRSSWVPSFFGDLVIDPFSPTRTISQMVEMMNNLERRRGLKMKEDEKNMYVIMEMPGLGKDEVKVYVEGNMLVMRGEQGKMDEERQSNDGRRYYSSRVELQTSDYKVEEIKAEMKNGVLRVVVPKVGGEEETGKKDVKEVQVE